MKKVLIGALVGAIILYVWSFLSWAVLPLHHHTYQYTPAQDAVLKALAENDVATGTYAMPMADNRNVSATDPAYKEAEEKMMNENYGKPAATIHYLKEGFNMNAGTMVKGLLFNFLAVLAVCLLLAPAFAKMSSFFGRWWLSLLVAMLIICTGPLIDFNWMGHSWEYTKDMILDTFLNWGITGLWLAWYFRP